MFPASRPAAQIKVIDAPLYKYSPTIDYLLRAGSDGRPAGLYYWQDTRG